MADKQIRDHALEHTSEHRASELRKTLWWMKARRLLIRRYLQRACELGPLSLLMDVGCGDGDDVDLLAEFGTVIGVERSPKLAERARKRGVAGQVFESEWLDLDGQFHVNLFTSFDVLEHCEDDRAFVDGFKRFGDHRHLVLISVPAGQFLYGAHDRLLHHHRRYSKKSLHGVLKSCGYEIIQSDYSLFFLLPFAALSRLKENVFRLFGREQTTVNLGEVPSWLNRVLLMIERAEIRMAEYFSYPVGLWLFVLARYDPPPGESGLKPCQDHGSAVSGSHPQKHC